MPGKRKGGAGASAEEKVLQTKRVSGGQVRRSKRNLSSTIRQSDPQSGNVPSSSGVASSSGVSAKCDNQSAILKAENERLKKELAELKKKSIDNSKWSVTLVHTDCFVNHDSL